MNQLIWMVSYEWHPSSFQYAHLIVNSEVERFNIPITASFPALADRCSILINQLVMDDYTASDGIWTNDFSRMIMYQVWIHKHE